MRSRVGQRHRQNGFTLLELLIVVAIIGVLISVLLPIASKVRTAARNSATTNTISQLSQVITAYYQDFRAYPGPLAYNQLYKSGQTSANFGGLGLTFPTPAPSGFNITAGAADLPSKITDSENLVLGLLGGLRLNSGATSYIYDPSLIGQGPSSLNQTATGKRNSAYMQEANNLSWRDTGAGRSGHFADESGDADDSMIPEFVDNYSSPMPIIYMRARIGVTAVSENPAGNATNGNNSIITYVASDATRNGTYDLHQILSYTGSYSGTWPGALTAASPMSGGRTIGEGKTLPLEYVNGVGSKPAVPYHGLSLAKSTNGVVTTKVLGPKDDTNYDYPYNAYPYFKNFSQGSGAVPVPQQKDAYILISAGPDRVYGTSDDITNFGAIGQ